tara:strand:+ start:282747 stop:284093 length:1347 start_codon:yes stop_codon:yes gene_type:complete
MIQYFIECIAFQVLFLSVYELFLKKETFFQWNRIYLITTHIISLILPWIKIEAINLLLSNRQEIPITKAAVLKQIFEASSKVDKIGIVNSSFSWSYLVFGCGAFVAILLFIYKLYQVYRFKKVSKKCEDGVHNIYKIPHSKTAFSFFKAVFIGEDIPEDQKIAIIAHELIHVRQLHSIDLFFYELLRICCWFNPLVYIYQKKTAELHEFIADAEIAKRDKKKQYQLLLAQVFDTENISFINQFFKSTLIKKRIVMLQKSKSKKCSKLKFALVLPLVSFMLIFTSLEAQESKIDKTVQLGETVVFAYLKSNVATNAPKETESQPLAIVDQSIPIDKLPVFPGCEDSEDGTICFKNMIIKHVSKVYRYPEDAAKNKEQGIVNAIFTIDANGTVSKIRTRKIGESSIALENEVKRILSSLPKMATAAEDKGQTVDVQFSIPITFKLLGLGK